MTAYAVPKPGTRRAEVWTTLGLARIRLKRPDVVTALFLRVMTPGRCAIGSDMRIYLGDPESLTEAQLSTMAAWAARVFKIAPEEARASMVRDGIPILANDEIEVVEA